MSLLIGNVHTTAKCLHLSHSTEDLYAGWARRYVHFHHRRLGHWQHPEDMGMGEVRQFLRYLSVDRNVSGSTHNQALAALGFLYGDVLGKDIGDFGALRVRRDGRIPDAITIEDAKRVLSCLMGVCKIIGQILYGSGLRLNECVTLRVKDIDFERHTIVARDTKGHQDRVTCLPIAVVDALRLHLRQVRTQWDIDVMEGYGEVWLPDALSVKYPNAGSEWIWQYIFPSSKLSVGEDGVTRRYHISPSTPQKAIRKAAKDAGIDKRVSPHVLRHSFATHLAERGVPVSKIQALLGHKHLKTTQRYIHIRNARDVESPLDWDDIRNGSA